MNVSMNISFNGDLSNATFINNFTNTSRVYNASSLWYYNNRLIYKLYLDNASSSVYNLSISFIDYTSDSEIGIYLIDEKNNSAFDVKNLSLAKLYNDDNSTVFDFKLAGNVSSYAFNYTAGIDSSRYRLEFGMYGSDKVVRYFDAELFNNTIRVCVNKDDVIHYEQLIISSTIRPVLMKSVYANCYIGGDYTRFAYQNAYLLKAYSTNMPYYLYVLIDGSLNYLGGIDGSIASYINIDNLEFQQTAYNASISSDGVGIKVDPDINFTSITFYDPRNLSTNTNIIIYNMDNDSLVFNETNYVSPNSFTTSYNYGGMNITNTTIFKVVITKHSSGGVIGVVVRYFNVISGVPSANKINAGLAFAFSLGLCLFGLTLTTASRTFGWFGLAIVFVALIILAFATWTWYVKMLFGIEVISLLYIFVISLTNKNIIQEAS
jgi:hypothetical protein